MTVREHVHAIRDELREGNLEPDRAAELLNILTSLLGNIADVIRSRDLAYNLRLLECYKQEAKANRAKIMAETSGEYISMREAKDTEREAIQMVQSLKYFLRVKESEMRYLK